MSKEKVHEILSHVDMSKIDLSSFKLSEKKFNEMSTLYRNRLILTCVTIIAENDSGKDTALQILEKIADNPNVYDYATVYAIERADVDKAIDDIVSYRNRNINDVKLKTIEKRMKATYKEMRKSIEAALENGATFTEEFNETTVNRCLQITQNAIESGRRKAAEVHVATVVETENLTKQNDTAECVEVVVEHTDNAKPKKISFWRRIFCRE